MGHEVPRQPREGRLIEDAAKASGLSVKKLAANAEISDTRWRHIVRGYQPAPGGGVNPVTAPANTLARMALAVGVSADDLARTGRTDAAELMARLEDRGRHHHDLVLSTPEGPAITIGWKQVNRGGQELDEIELVYASQTMTAKQKLETIRMILHLRAQVEQEATAEAQPEQAGGGEETIAK